MSIVGLDPGEEKRWREGREVRRRERVWEGQRRGDTETGEMEGEGGRGDAGRVPHYTSYRNGAT